MGRPWSEEDVLTLVAMRRDGSSSAEIAALLSRPEVSVRVKAHGLGLARPRRKKAQPIECEVPAWVPRRLVKDYQIIAAEDGEEAAASWARSEKAKA